MTPRERSIQQIADAARTAVEAWGMGRDEGMCALASSYLHARLTEAGFAPRFVRGYIVCDRPHAKLRGLFFEAGRPEGHVIHESHTWIVVDGTLIDITASQFNDQLDQGCAFKDITIGPVSQMRRHVEPIEAEPVLLQAGEDWPTVFSQMHRQLMEAGAP